jgi:predicted flap endonuclease-1-like 5' DNA nuclease
MTVETILAGFVGLLAGVLLALWLDSQTLVRRVQEANEQKGKAQAAVQKFQIQHQATEQQVRLLQGELATAVQDNTQYETMIARQLAEIEASREQLQTTIATHEALRENLQETHDRLEELEGLQVTAEAQLAAAEAEKSRLLGDVQLMEGEIVSLEAKVEALQTELQAANELREQLATVQERLQTADSHSKKLQAKMDDLRVKMNYSSKNQLQLIRGIGPAYGRRLNEFGIQTFADLADCDPDQIANIIKKKDWQSVDIQKWIEEARALAARLGPDA